VEHGLPRSGALFVLCVLILLSIAFGRSSAEKGPFASADALLAEGRIEDAREELGRIADEHEGSRLGHEALYRLNRLEQDGAAYLERLARLAEEWDDPRAWLDLAGYRYAAGAYEAAASSYARACRSLTGESAADCACWRGVSLTAAGRTEEGIDVLLQAARSAKGSPAGIRARFLAAQAYAGAGDFGRAAETVEPLLRGSHDFSAAALLLAARAERGRGHEEKARALRDELLARHPGSIEAEEGGRSPGAADEETEPRPRAPRREKGAGAFFVQIGSFAEEENALRFAGEQREKGIGAIGVDRAARDGREVFQVRIGPFTEREDARTARDNLARQGLAGNVVQAEGDEE
jgi:tetratricopeptide (TPR) repeat protein